MRRTPRTFFVLMLVAIVVVASASALLAAKFKSTWKSPESGLLNFAGKKVVALVITGDQNLEISAEEALARELTARGLQGVAAYRMIPREELRDRDKARPWFERAGVTGVVAMRVVMTEKETVYTPDTWAQPYYGSFWNYYGYGWSSVVVLGGGSTQVDRIVTIETLVFNVPKNQLMWAGASEKTNPKDAQQVVKELVKEVIQEMAKEGLVPKGAK